MSGGRCCRCRGRCCTARDRLRRLRHLHGDGQLEVGEGGGSGANGGAQERPGDRQAITLDLAYRFQINFIFCLFFFSICLLVTIKMNLECKC